jgi:hypothetical protein
MTGKTAKQIAHPVSECTGEKAELASFKDAGVDIPVTSKVYKSNKGFFIVRYRKTALGVPDCDKIIALATLLTNAFKDQKVYLAIMPATSHKGGDFGGITKDAAALLNDCGVITDIVDWQVAEEGDVTAFDA